MSEICFVDTTIRDGQLSLWALGMRTRDMLAIAEQMDRCGFEAMEFFGFAAIKKLVREQKENPWDWVKLGARRFSRTRLRYHGGLSSGFEKIPRSVLKLMIERVVASGVTLTRSSNPWNDYRILEQEMKELRDLGMEMVANIIYSVSPKHTDAYYAEKAREAAAMRPYRICFKDVGGLLTPERTRTLLPIVMKNAGEIPVEFHAHCINTLAPLCYLEAIQLGVNRLHTAVPPLANGSSQPSIFNVANNARSLGYEPVADLEAVKPVEEHFTSVARRNGHPIGTPREYDYFQYRHQVPGGMISNLRHQLQIVGMEDRMQATLEEAARVREEFGYPIMVTPLAQFVGSQAAINVVTGERYKEVTDQTIQYALGYWGEEGARLMHANVKDKILGRSRAKVWKGWTPPEPSLEEVRSKFGGPGVSDEELTLRVIAGADAVANMLSGEPPKEIVNAASPLRTMMEQIAKLRHCRQVSIRKDGLSLRLEKRG